MGKTHQKFLKKEKSKVKMKNSKKLLPKGQNLTDTNFKVKKIIIKDQVKPRDTGELTTTRNLNIQDLLSRFGHHNVNMKKDALDGLNELINSYPSEIIKAHLSILIQNLPKLIVDLNGKIRKETIHLLAKIFSKTECHLLEPFFPSLSSYLICGLTHIDRAIQEDSLYFLDTLLNSVPNLCAESAPKILPICLDLVSHSNSFSRTLSLNLDSSSTSMKWRIKVLHRIQLLLSCLNSFNGSDSNKEMDEDKKDVELTDTEKYYFSFYMTNQFFICKLHLDCLGQEGETLETYSLKEFSNSLIPLLFDMFLEIMPQREDNAGVSTDICTIITEEEAEILKHIVQIMLLVWDIISKEENSKEKLEVLSREYGKQILVKLIEKRFPYAIRTNKNRKVSGSLENGKIDTFCKLLNLSICKLIILYGNSSSWNCILPYMKNMFRNADMFNNDESALFTFCISTICHGNKSEESMYFLNRAIKTVMSSNCTLAHYFSVFLTDIAKNRELKEFHSEASFKAWLESLPTKLIKSKISASVLENICQIAIRNYIPFIDSLDALIEAILDNIPSIHIDGIDKEKGQMKIATLLYYVKEWDQELIDGLKKAIEKEYWGPSVTGYIKYILNLKRRRLKI